MSAPPFRAEFWRHPEKWPTFDPPGFTYIARAALLVGEAMFGAEWTGKEPITEPVEDLPRKWEALPRHAYLIPGIKLRQREREIAAMSPEEAAVENEKARKLLESLMKMRSVSLSSGKLPPKRLADYSAEDWEDARRGNQRDIEAAAPLLGRWDRVQQEIARAALYGELGFALREPSGSMTAGDPNWWNRDSWRTPFLGGYLSPTSTSTPTYAGDGYRPVFFVVSDVAALCAKWRTSTPSSEWAPGPDQTLKDWCTGQIVERAAKTRLGAKGNRNPSEREVCFELADMWIEAGMSGGTWKTIQTYRAASRAS